MSSTQMKLESSMTLRERVRIWWRLPGLCKFNCHDWRDGPGSDCRQCGWPDTFFDPAPIAACRIDAWGMDRLPSFAQRLYDEAPEYPMTEQEIDEAVCIAMGRKPQGDEG